MLQQLIVQLTPRPIHTPNHIRDMTNTSGYAETTLLHLNDEISQHRDTIASLTRRLADAEALNSMLRTDVDTHYAETVQLTSQLDQSKAQNGRLEGSLRTVNESALQDAEARNRVVAALQEEVKALNAELTLALKSPVPETGTSATNGEVCGLVKGVK